MQDADIIPECEWLAAIYQSRRQHEVDYYGWQSCDEIQDPESGRREDVLSHNVIPIFPVNLTHLHVRVLFGPVICVRYTQESCYKPLYRSKQMWTELGVRWRYMAPQAPTV